jgi:hypothetical protein
MHACTILTTGLSFGKLQIFWQFFVTAYGTRRSRCHRSLFKGLFIVTSFFLASNFEALDENLTNESGFWSAAKPPALKIAIFFIPLTTASTKMFNGICKKFTEINLEYVLISF